MSASVSTASLDRVAAEKIWALSPASALVPTRLTRSTGCCSLVMLSELDRPPSLSSIKSGAPGAFGSTVSMRMSRVSEMF